MATVAGSPMTAGVLLLGAAGGALLVLGVEWMSRGRASAAYGVALVFASAVYVYFASSAGADDWFNTEVGGMLVFAAVAVGGVRWSGLVLAVGWTLHAGWDVLLHSGPEAAFVPASYVSLCVGFDLVVAGALLVRAIPREERAEPVS